MYSQLSNLFRRTSQKGFTLIELLVVLAILGILAAALLASINPVEQLKKAQDTSLKNVASQFVSANVRYYSVHNALPWGTVASGGANCYSGGNSLAQISLSTLSPCITTLIGEGELKQSFLNSSNLGQVVATNVAGSGDVVVCFVPQSESQQRDPNTKYTQSGTAGTSCKSTGGTNSCSWCAQ